jgi:hypothetical protein
VDNEDIVDYYAPAPIPRKVRCIEALSATDRVAWEHVMRKEEAPPIPPPHGAEAPYPEGQAPHPQRDEALEQLRGAQGIGTLGVTLIGGAVAAALGLLVAIPLVRRAKKRPAPAKPKPKPAPQARRPRRKRADA